MFTIIKHNMAYGKGYSKGFKKSTAKKSSRGYAKKSYRAPMYRAPMATSMATRIGVFKTVTSLGSSTSELAIPMKDAAVTNASSNGLSAFLSMYQNFRPVSFTVQVFPRSQDGASTVLAMGADLNENKAAQTQADVLAKYGGKIHCLKDGRTIAKKISFNQERHKHMISTSLATEAGLANWASTVLLGFSDTHIPVDIVMHLTVAAQGWGQGTN